MKTIIGILLSVSSLFCSYPYRDIHQPIIKLPSKTQVLQLGNPRTGSTVIFNVLNYLFEDKNYMYYSNTSMRVMKIHSLNEWRNKGVNQVYIIQTIRDPLDMIASYHKKDGRFPKDYIDPIERVKANKKLENCIVYHIILRYEDFDQNNFTYIFDTLEIEMGIHIPDEEKEKIASIFSKKAMLEIANSHKDFSTFDRFTGIHGNHLTNAKFFELFSYKQAKEFYEKSYSLRKKWGYPDLDLTQIYNNTRKTQ